LFHSAIKTFDQIALDKADEKTLMEIRREAHMMEKLGTYSLESIVIHCLTWICNLGNHPNVINFIGAVTKPSPGAKLCIVTEYCKKGSLYDYLIKKRRKVSKLVIIKICRDIAAGIVVSCQHMRDLQFCLPYHIS
jgi:serine/threonine protein kinase